MKLKRLPEDFQVEELTPVEAGEQGRFTLLPAGQAGLGTLEAVEAICRRWNLSGRQVSYGGLKDRHAVTIQYLTILDGPERSLHESSFDLEPLGPARPPLRPAALPRQPVPDRPPRPDRRGRRPRPSPRSRASRGRPAELLRRPAVRLGRVLRRVHRPGLAEGRPRAGPAAGAGRAQPVRPLGRRRPQKAILRDCWGRWAEAKARLERSSARSIVTYLVDHPDRLPRAPSPGSSESCARSTSRRSRATSGTWCSRAGSSGTPGPSSA